MSLVQPFRPPCDVSGDLVWLSLNNRDSSVLFVCLCEAFYSCLIITDSPQKHVHFYFIFCGSHLCVLPRECKLHGLMRRTKPVMAFRSCGCSDFTNTFLSAHMGTCNFNNCTKQLSVVRLMPPTRNLLCSKSLTINDSGRFLGIIG